jgi:hypothetical protein
LKSYEKLSNRPAVYIEILCQTANLLHKAVETRIETNNGLGFYVKTTNRMKTEGLRIR